MYYCVLCVRAGAENEAFLARPEVQALLVQYYREEEADKAADAAAVEEEEREEERWAEWQRYCEAHVKCEPALRAWASARAQPSLAVPV